MQLDKYAARIMQDVLYSISYLYRTVLCTFGTSPVESLMAAMCQSFSNITTFMAGAVTGPILISPHMIPRWHGKPRKDVEIECRQLHHTNFYHSSDTKVYDDSPIASYHVSPRSRLAAVTRSQAALSNPPSLAQKCLPASCSLIRASRSATASLTSGLGWKSPKAR